MKITINLVGKKFILKTEDVSEYNEIGETYREIDKLEDAEKIVRHIYPGPNYHCDFRSAVVMASDVYEDDNGNRFYSEPTKVWSMSREEWQA